MARKTSEGIMANSHAMMQYRDKEIGGVNRSWVRCPFPLRASCTNAFSLDGANPNRASRQALASAMRFVREVGAQSSSFQQVI